MIIILPSIREAPLLLSLLVHRIAEAIYTAVPKYLWGNSASFKNLACIDPVLTVRIKALLELRSELDCRSADAENVRICAELLNLSLEVYPVSRTILNLGVTYPLEYANM